MTAKQPPEGDVIPRKLVETAFSHWWAFVLPVVLAPALVVALARHPAVYASRATVWVAAGALASTSYVNDPQMTAAKAQVQVLGDLLATAAFREAVAVAAGLVAAEAPAEARAAAGDEVAAGASAAAIGPNLLGVIVSNAAPDRAQRVAVAVIAEFQARALSETARQAAALLDSYQRELVAANGELSAAQAELAAYTKVHPIAPGATGPDPEHERLQSRVDTATTVVDGLAQALREARLKAAGDSGLQEVTLTVQDPPSLPTAPEAVPATTRYGYPAAALFLGAVVGVGAIYFRYRADHTIRSRADIAGGGVPLLGTVPEIGHRGWLQRYTPLRLLARRRRNYARRMAAALLPLAGGESGRR
ncbi:MAG: hypothetical protein IT304_05355 [Dehalococcoidia bacterium]|nr:hypothetical protein [Dehalococcoidia bacterium]